MIASGKDEDLYFLPISETTAEALVENAVSLNMLSIPELAAVLLILNLPSLTRSVLTSPGIEAQYAKALDFGLAIDNRELFAEKLIASPS